MAENINKRNGRNVVTIIKRNIVMIVMVIIMKWY